MPEDTAKMCVGPHPQATESESYHSYELGGARDGEAALHFGAAAGAAEILLFY